MNLIKSTGTFSFFTILSRILGYLRDLLIAIYLGSGPIADAFFVAFRIPNTFRRLFSEGTFNAAFVPSYSSEIIKGKKQWVPIQLPNQQRGEPAAMCHAAHRDLHKYGR